MVAGSRIGGHNALPDTKVENAFPHRHHIAGHLVPEQSRRPDHLGVITAAENFYVGTTGERGSNANQHFAGPDSWNRNRFEANVLFSIQNRCLHSINGYWHEIRSCGCTTTFKERSPGRWAMEIPRLISERETQSEISCSKG